jgi:hypothetical protein
VQGSTSVEDRSNNFVGPTLLYPTIASTPSTELVVQRSSPTPVLIDQTIGAQSKSSGAPLPALSRSDPSGSDARAAESAVGSKGDPRVLGLVVDASAAESGAANLAGVGNEQTPFSGSLAFTGASSMLLGLIAIVILVAGSALVSLGSRRH